MLIVTVEVIIGILAAGVCALAPSLSHFMGTVGEKELCSQCARRNCIARKESMPDGYFLYRWMFATFLRVRKRCKLFSDAEPGWRLGTFFAGIVVYLIPLWSEGISVFSVIYGMSAAMLLCLAVVDWNTQYIPFECTVVIFICGLIRLFADGTNWWEYVIGLFAVSGFLYIADRVGTRILRRRYQDDTIDSVIGDGDIKLMAATGLLLGWKLNFMALGIGCIMGSVIHLTLMKIKGSGRQFAFGPYLSLGVFITMICGEQLVSWYLNLIGFYAY